MTTRAATLQAEPKTRNISGLGAQTVVALPPSTLDPSVGQMQVYVNGVLIIRQYDPTMEQP